MSAAQEASSPAIKALTQEQYKAWLQKGAEKKRKEAEEYGRLKKEALSQAQWFEKALKSLTHKEMTKRRRATIRVIPSPSASGKKLSSTAPASSERPASSCAPPTSDSASTASLSGSLPISALERGEVVKEDPGAEPSDPPPKRQRAARPSGVPKRQAEEDNVLDSQKTYSKTPKGKCLACHYRDLRKAGGRKHTCSPEERALAQKARARRFAVERAGQLAEKLVQEACGE
jgi:hypothetical protein